jgi:hypothetical protein
MNKSRKSGTAIPKLSVSSQPRVKLGRRPLSADGQARDVRLVVLLTPAEAAAFEAQAKAEKTDSRALARRALHDKCPMIST